MQRREGELTIDEHHELVYQGKKAWYVYSRHGGLVHYYASAIYMPEDRLGREITGFKNYFFALACSLQMKAKLKKKISR